jgi:TolB-like protein
MATAQRPTSRKYAPEPIADQEHVFPLLDKICNSSGFRRSDRLQRFLRYIAEQTLQNPAQPLKEYQIGVAVFDKGASFDPQQDPIVRVEASRLRLRLTEYYMGPGHADPIMIEVPKGRYVPSFRTRVSGARSPVALLIPRSNNQQSAGDLHRDQQVHSIAVLPFANASTEGEMEYLSEGITETLTNRLAQISKLRVAPRSRVRVYRNPEADLMQTARELDVEFLLVGRVLLRGDRLRVQAELIDCVRDAQIWGQSYTRRPSCLLAMEDEIAREILTQLRPKFGDAELRRITRHDTDNAAAYQHYLKGRYYWNKRTSEDLTLGIQHFHKALEEDPEYALAHSGLADSYIALGTFGVLSPREIFPLAKASALRALEIDSGLAEAHTSLATACACYDWDWASAEEHFRFAIRIDPAYSIAYHWYGYCLCGYGKLSEGISLLERAQQLDPLSLMIQTQVGSAFYAAREFDRGEAACLAVLAMDSRFWTAHWFLGLIYQQKGLMEQASAVLEHEVELSDSNTLALGSLAHHYGLTGKRRRAVSLLNRLKRQSERKYVNPWCIALAFAGLNDWEETLVWLQRAYQQRSPSLALWLKGDPRLDPLRSDPRFRSLVRSIGLPD